jgi:hypothetical protein
MLFGSGIALAVESLGTFSWQLAPFCNVLTLTIARDGPIATVSGYDDGCGAGQRQAAVGSAFPNPDGTVGIGLTVLNPTAAASTIQALIGAGTSSGSWKDQTGNAGAFVFNPGSSPAGSPRPSGGSCPPDSVKSGPICIDKYEASVWDTAGNPELVQKIRAGTVTLAELQSGGAIQRGTTNSNYGAGCSDSGNSCVNIYAVSIAGVTPSRFISWFQAAVAPRNSGKRLPTNAEWQAAALGTAVVPSNPILLGCHIDNSGGVADATGLRSCVSEVGAFDMVGNLWEWVADWVTVVTCGSWGDFSDDNQCLGDGAGGGFDSPPSALLRGGSFINYRGSRAGVFTVSGGPPSSAAATLGFARPARNWKSRHGHPPHDQQRLTKRKELRHPPSHDSADLHVPTAIESRRGHHTICPVGPFGPSSRMTAVTPKQIEALASS